MELHERSGLDSREGAGSLGIMDSKAVLEQALALPMKKRAEIADELLKSLDPQGSEHSEEWWIAEVERRSKEMDEDPSCVRTWDQIKAELGR